MSRPIAALALLTTCVVALADSPPDGVVEEIVELRQAFGNADAFATDEKQFADAVRREASQTQPYGGFQPRERGWGDYPPRDAFVPSPTNPAYNRSENRLDSSPPVKRRHQLLRAAFALEKIAHELELADHSQEADTVRNAAEKLRRSARESDADNKGSAKAREGKKRLAERKRIAEEHLRRVEKARARAGAARAEIQQARKQAEAAKAEARQRDTESGLAQPAGNAKGQSELDPKTDIETQRRLLKRLLDRADINGERQMIQELRQSASESDRPRNPFGFAFPSSSPEQSTASGSPSSAESEPRDDRKAPADIDPGPR